MAHADLMLFALGPSQPFGQGVAQALGGALSAHEERDFEDGEHKARPLVSVRGRDVYVLHALYGEPGQSANDKLCRLLFFIGAVKDAGAARVTAIAPYLAYARKDRKTQPRDPVSTRYVATLFEAVGTDVVLTMDVHNPAAYQNAFRCRTELLEAGPLFAQHLLPQLRGGELVVVSPDAGGMKRADRLRQRLSHILGAPVGGALAEKHRSGGILTGHLLAGDVSGKTAVIVDDLISSGGTLARTARVCREHGAAAVIAVATHGLFAAGAETELMEPALERILVTDTVPAFRIAASAIMPKLTVLPCAPLFAEAIRRLHADESIEELLGF
jgi:ribose-phosphate pyrophosphokinase